jgi:hypothetical protein
MQRLSDVLDTTKYQSAQRLEMKPGEERELLLLGWNQNEGDYGEYVTVRLRDGDTGLNYYLNTSSRGVRGVLDNLDALIEEGKVSLPLLVTVRRTKRSWLIS